MRAVSLLSNGNVSFLFVLRAMFIIVWIWIPKETNRRKLFCAIGRFTRKFSTLETRRKTPDMKEYIHLHGGEV